MAVDGVRAGFQVASHVLRGGRSHLACVARPGFPSTTDLRFAGCRQAAAATAPVPLTTMRLPCRELGVLAVRTQLERIREPGLPPRQILLDARLVVRRSG